MLTDHEAFARDVLRELIEIDTTDATGDNDRAAHAMERRLIEAAWRRKWPARSSSRHWRSPS